MTSPSADNPMPIDDSPEPQRDHKALVREILLAVALLAIVGAGVGGYFVGRRSVKPGTPAAAASDQAKDVIATVSVAPLQLSTIAQQVIAYGTVVAPANEVRAVSVPFESRVTKVRVTPGQTVAAGQPLIEVEGSAAAVLALAEAKNAAAAAQRDLDLVTQRYKQNLATNTELYTAQNALRTAQGRLQSLEQGGQGTARVLSAQVAGIVSKVDVQLGQVVPIGSPLVEVAGRNEIEVKLGAEPEDVPLLKAGQAVRIHRTDDTNAPVVTGKIRLIGQRLDPATRLVDVMVSLPPDAPLMLDSFVSGHMLTRETPDALVIARDAVLPGDAGAHTLFTVKDGVAVKHDVRVGVENDEQVQVISDDLKPGDPVVVVGNYTLDDGMKVTIQPAATQPGTTQSDTTQPAATQPATTSPAMRQLPVASPGGRP